MVESTEILIAAIAALDSPLQRATRLLTEMPNEMAEACKKAQQDSKFDEIFSQEVEVEVKGAARSAKGAKKAASKKTSTSTTSSTASYSDASSRTSTTRSGKGFAAAAAKPGKTGSKTLNSIVNQLTSQKHDDWAARVALLNAPTIDLLVKAEKAGKLSEALASIAKGFIAAIVAAEGQERAPAICPLPRAFSPRSLRSDSAPHLSRSVASIPCFHAAHL